MFIICRYWAESFRPSGRKLSIGLWKLPSLHIGTLRGEVCFFGKFFILSLSFSDMKRNFFAIFQKFLRQNCLNSILRVHRNIMRRNVFYWKKLAFLVNFGKWAQKNRIFVDNFPHDCRKNSLLVQRINLRKTSSLKKFLCSPFSDNERKVFVPLAKVCR